MNKVDAETLLILLDDYARSVCSYDYGLPTYNINPGDLPEHMDNMVDIVVNFIKEYNNVQ